VVPRRRSLGIWTRLAPKLRHLTTGVEKADSLAFDLHKWISLTYDIGCVLVRDETAHLRAFALTPDYLKLQGAKASSMSDYGIDLSRRFRALKVWMAFKEHGTRKFGEIVQQNVDEARYLETLIKKTRELEILAPVSLNVVCFRFRPARLSEAQIDALNRMILDGTAMPFSTTINGKYAIRFCTVNHRTKFEDIDYFVNEVLQLGASMQDESIAKNYMERINRVYEKLA
jgi:aromatic-L-amino-acid decarboxylase